MNFVRSVPTMLKTGLQQCLGPGEISILQCFSTVKVSLTCPWFCDRQNVPRNLSLVPETVLRPTPKLFMQSAFLNFRKMFCDMRCFIFQVRDGNWKNGSVPKARASRPQKQKHNTKR